MISTDIGLWLGAGLAIMMTSCLYKDNFAYKVAEAFFLGAAIGNSIIYAIQNVNNLGVSKLLNGNWTSIIPLLLGLLIFTRLIPERKYRWPGIYPIAVLTAIGVGLAMRSVLMAQVVTPIAQSMLPIINTSIENLFNNLLIIIGTLTALIYFIYTTEHEGPIGYLSRIGRYLMMIAFGQAIGSKVITFTSAFLGVLTYLLSDWLGLI